MPGTPIEKVDEFIEKLKEIVKPDPKESNDIFENFMLTEYYFRQQLATHEVSDETLEKMLYFFKWRLVQAGDAVGMKAALCIGEALTQAALNAIHGLGGGVSEDRVIRSKGIQRFQELLTGAKPKHNIITLRLYDDSKDATIKFANEMETLYMKDIMINAYLKVFDTIEEDVVKMHPDLQLDKLVINYWYYYIVIDATRLADHGIHICDIINEIMKNYKEIYFMTAHILNTTQLGLYCFLKENVPQIRIQVILEEWMLERSSTIVHGKYLMNCYVSENKNDPGHYILEANDVNTEIMALENLIYDPRVNPFGCKTSNIQTTYELFGVCEAAARLHEEILYTAANLSDTKEILPRHYKMLADNILSNGSFKYASRTSLKKDSAMDPLRLMSFEIPTEMLTHSLKTSRKFPIRDPVSASFFGELPKMGSGIANTIAYKNRKQE